ncbi:hypothetical protein AB6D11_00665 [Vibrio splendidus]
MNSDPLVSSGFIESLLAKCDFGELTLRSSSVVSDKLLRLEVACEFNDPQAEPSETRSRSLVLKRGNVEQVWHVTHDFLHNTHDVNQWLQRHTPVDPSILKNIVARSIGALGAGHWTPVRDHTFLNTDAMMTNAIDTIVGEKEAMILMSPCDHGSMLYATFESKGVNVLRMMGTALPHGASQSDIEQHVAEWVKQLEVAIENSYACRLSSQSNPNGTTDKMVCSFDNASHQAGFDPL